MSKYAVTDLPQSGTLSIVQGSQSIEIEYDDIRVARDVHSAPRPVVYYDRGRAYDTYQPPITYRYTVSLSTKVHAQPVLPDHDLAWSVTWTAMDSTGSFTFRCVQNLKSVKPAGHHFDLGLAFTTNNDLLKT